MSEDLIRRSDAIKAVKEYLDLCCLTEAQFHKEAKDYNEEIARDILNQITPSIDIEPKRGWWETVFMSEATGWDVSVAGRDPIYGHRCSICKEETFNNDVGEEMLTNFCPNCGADMRKEGE